MVLISVNRNVLLISLVGFLIVLCVLGFLFETRHRKKLAKESVAEKRPSPTRHILSRVQDAELEEDLRNTANVHFWDYVCGYKVEDLRSHPLFPFSPFRRDTTDRLQLEISDVHFGTRIFGYLHPPTDGYYSFAISSDDCSELWLSADEDPLHAELIAQVGGKTGKEWSYLGQFDKYPQQQTNEIKLSSGEKYFFDILWKQERGRGHVQVVWKKPFASLFEVIGSKYISRYYDDSLIENGILHLDHLKGDLLLRDLPSHVKQFTKERKKMLQSRSTPYQRDSAEFLQLPHIQFQEIQSALVECSYHPSWIIEANSEAALRLEQYEGVHLPHYFNISTKVYPKDQTWDHTSNCEGVSLKPMHCQGNEVEDESSAMWAVNKLMAALKRTFKNRFKLHTVVNVERAHDKLTGDRFLIELALHDTTKDNLVRRISVYVFRPLHAKKICYPKDFQWNKNAMVHLILTVKNQASWVQQYIESLSNIFVKTKDNNFNLIITDFESFDVDIEELLKRSPLPHWKVIKQIGRFHKTSAIQEAIDSIGDQNSIAMQTDLHLEFPLNFIDDSRKHCVQGKMGYTPLLMRLGCGKYSHRPAGFWEAFGYGIFGVYKSDWDHLGGMDVEKFRNAWGGEDWDFADRVIKSGLEIERLRVPYFFHYFHTKKGMWDNKY